MAKHSVSVVIPFHNAESVIAQTLETVVNALCSSALVSKYEIIVVDDASTDNSRQIILDSFPSVRVFSIDKRCYYIQAANKGMFHAANDLVLLLTQGIFLPTNYFDVMIPYLFVRDKIFAVGSKMTSATGYSSSQNKPFFYSGRVEWRARTEEVSTNDVVKRHHTIMLERGNILMQRQTMLTLGGYNTLFTAYPTSDFDFSLHGWCLGYRCLYVDEIECRIVEPSATSQDWGEKQEDGESELNEMLLHEFYRSGLHYIKYKLKMNIFFLISLVVPITLLHKTRWAYFRLIRNYKAVETERGTRYHCLMYNLKEVQKYFFEE